MSVTSSSRRAKSRARCEHISRSPSRRTRWCRQRVPDAPRLSGLRQGLAPPVVAGRAVAVRADRRLISPSCPTEEVCGSVTDVPERATWGEKLPPVAPPHKATVLPPISPTVTSPPLRRWRRVIVTQGVTPWSAWPPITLDSADVLSRPLSHCTHDLPSRQPRRTSGADH
jgi:hypothetical protein